jgi:hypothetical protein
MPRQQSLLAPLFRSLPRNGLVNTIPKRVMQEFNNKETVIVSFVLYAVRAKAVSGKPNLVDFEEM